MNNENKTNINCAVPIYLNFFKNPYISTICEY